ncbi:MAG: TetR/AcrR family transcriptional regulator [Alphaproteobacteria bacterium]|nr:TetR/AcrR family transcriptional regulator [Alphaproteobacteria bacterium]
MSDERIHAPGADESETHDRILDAAEDLFGTEGFAAASVRDVAARAQTSPGSINYYFGSKNGLIRAVIKRIGTPLNEARLARLAELTDRHGDAPIPLRDILMSFLEPLFDDRTTRHEAISRLLAQVTVANDPLIGKYWSEILGPTGNTYIDVLRRALPDLSPDDLFLRYQFFLMATYDSRTFSSWYWAWAKSSFDQDAVSMTLEERVSLFESIFLAPGRAA